MIEEFFATEVAVGVSVEDVADYKSSASIQSSSSSLVYIIPPVPKEGKGSDY